MFICNECLEKHYTNFALMVSYGKCECCDQTNECADIPSYKLNPKEEKIKDTKITHVYLFPNGMLAVFNEKDEQVGELQGAYSNTKHCRISELADKNTIWHGLKPIETIV